MAIKILAPKNMGLKAHSNDFLANGCNGFEYISVIYGDSSPTKIILLGRCLQAVTVRTRYAFHRI